MLYGILNEILQKSERKILLGILFRILSSLLMFEQNPNVASLQAWDSAWNSLTVPLNSSMLMPLH